MTPLGVLGWVAAGAAAIALICMAVVTIAATFRTLNKERQANNQQDGEQHE